MRGLLILFLCCLPVWNLAQDFKLSAINLTVQEGLAGDNVYCAFQDEKGYIWFGTETGVSRYNGREFENFYRSDGLGDNEIFRIDQDSQGRIWFSAFNGILSYYSDGKFYNGNTDESLAAHDLNEYYINFFEDSYGAVWFATTRAVYVLNKAGQFSKIELKKDVNLTVQNFREENGRILGFTTRFVEVAFPGNDDLNYSLIPYDEEDGLHVFSKYFRNKTTYLNPYNAQQSRRYLTQLADMDIPPNTILSKIQQYGDERWFCGFEGVYRVQLGSKSEVLFKDELVTHVLKDRERGYWFTSLGKGVFYTPSLKYRSVSNFNGKPIGMVSSLLPDGNEIYFAGSGGLFGSLEEGQISVFNADLKGGRAMAKNISNDFQKNSFLVASESLLLRFKDRQLVRKTPMPVKVIKQWGDKFVLGNKGSLVVFEASRLLELQSLSLKDFRSSRAIHRPTEWSAFFAEIDGYVIDVEISANGLYIATTSGLLFLSPNHELTTISDVPLEDLRVNDILLLDTNELVVATHGFGIFIRNGSEWTQISREDGLLSNISRKVWAQSKDTLWIASNGGINRVVLTKESPVISNLTKTDGLLSEEVYDIVVQKEKLYAATSRGISEIDIQDWERDDISPLVTLKDMTVDGKKLSGDSLQLPYRSNNITLDFDGIHFKSLERIAYEFRTVGYDENWQRTNVNSINYGGLSPGTYQFQVRTLSAFGNSSETAYLTFTILTPFWLTWWFVVIVALVLIALIIWVLRVIVERNKRKTKKEFEFQLRIVEAERKALQSQLNPHFIFNSLNSIQKMVLKKNPEAAYNYLEKFGKLIRRVLELSDKSMIPVGEELDTLKLYMDLENLRLGDKFDYDISLDREVDTSRLIPSLLIQPYVENSIWHGISHLKTERRGKIDIGITNHDSDLLIVVTDNGVGREPNLESKGLGTKIVNELVSNFRGEKSGKVTIDDLVNGDARMGTRVKITIKDKMKSYDKSLNS